MSLTLADFRTRVMTAIGLSGTTEQGYVDAWLNEAMEQVMLRTKVKISLADMAFTADEGDYELPDILSVDRILVTYQGQQIPLEPMDSSEIDWKRQVSATSECPRYYSIEGYNMLRVWPIPGSALDVSIRYVPRPTAMSSSGDSPADSTRGIPSELHYIIEAYAKWKAADWDDDTSSKVGMDYHQEYEQGIVRARRELQRRRGPMPPARLRRNRLVIPVSNGIDTG